jgi:4-nitrophenyl phosphatase
MKCAKASVRQPLTYIFDLDGVIYRGAERQPYVAETLAELRKRGDTVYFYTNNSSLSRQSYATRLQGFEIEASVDEIMTSSYATALYLTETEAIGKTVYQIGQEGVESELSAIGMKVIKDHDEPDAHIDYVVVGIDVLFTYEKLARAQSAILSGATFIATNEDMTYPTESGTVRPGNGAIVASVRAATSIEPVVLGKPHGYALQKILEHTDTPLDRAVMVGDNLATDIAAGNRIGMHTALVLTGLTSRKQAEAAQGEMKPGEIIETLRELLK